MSTLLFPSCQVGNKLVGGIREGSDRCDDAPKTGSLCPSHLCFHPSTQAETVVNEIITTFEFYVKRIAATLR